MRSIAALAVFAVSWAALLAWSALATPHPIVLADEAFYLLPALFGYTAENLERWGASFHIPIHLFFGIYGVADGSHAYAAAKVMNAVFFAAAALPAFAVARRLLAPPAAAVFAAIAVSIPASAVTRYFMPDALFYLGFWCVVWIVVRCLPAGGWQLPLAGGAAAGLLSLVKPHALGLACGLALFVLFRSGRGIRYRLLGAAALLAAFWLARLLASGVLSGQWEASPGGPMYGVLLSQARFDVQALLVNLAGQVASLAFLAAAPLAAAALALRQRRVDPQLRDFLLLALCVQLALIAMTVAFAQSIYAATGGGHAASRLHGRVWAYALPLLMLCYVAMLQRGALPEVARSKRFLAAAAATAGLGAATLALWFDLSRVDFPDLMMLWPSLPTLLLALAVIASCAAAAFFLARRGREWMPMAPLLWWVAISALTSAALWVAPLAGLGPHAHPLDAALTGHPRVQAAKGTADGLIAGNLQMQWETFLVVFHLRSRAWIVFPQDFEVRERDIPPGTRWALLLPGIRYAGGGEREAVGPLTFIRFDARPGSGSARPQALDQRVDDAAALRGHRAAQSQ